MLSSKKTPKVFEPYETTLMIMKSIIFSSDVDTRSKDVTDKELLNASDITLSPEIGQALIAKAKAMQKLYGEVIGRHVNHPYPKWQFFSDDELYMELSPYPDGSYSLICDSALRNEP